ncbi:hypothetical protein FAZ69_16160 [Trinickia terrae]|uniref:Uncharacterized protein n=1 Tax=Trinickia terrae TaxID=2571161 RepID=A0A4U1I3J4_9BURK|nr:hypothetical protein [Trinickia terrae]TKC87809.1 hypothetical protein FAZ69_16160 [Trinickia terrae]
MAANAGVRQRWLPDAPVSCVRGRLWEEFSTWGEAKPVDIARKKSIWCAGMLACTLKNHAYCMREIYPKYSELFVNSGGYFYLYSGSP